MSAARRMRTWCRGVLLAAVYERGSYGVTRDPKESFAWLRRAFLQDHLEATFAAGLADAEGHGVEVDLAQALAWIQRAARRGHGRATQYMRQDEQGAQGARQLPPAPLQQ